MNTTILPFVQGLALDPAMTRIIGEAYDMACRELHDRGQPLVVRDIIAKRIIQIAKTGELDPAQICERAILSLGIGKMG